MNTSRRDMAMLLATAAITKAQEKPPLPSKVYKYEDLTVRQNGKNRQRPILDGKTHTGFNVRVHETELAPGLAPHASHHHVHEEMIFIREGTLEITISGRSQRAGPGSVVCVASNEEHGWKNVGDTQARYFVLALGQQA